MCHKFVDIFIVSLKFVSDSRVYDIHIIIAIKIALRLFPHSVPFTITSFSLF